MFFFFFLFHIFQSVHLGRALDTFFVCINARFGVTPVEGAPCRTSSFPAGRRVFRWVKRDGRCAGVSWPTMWLSAGGGVRVAESVRRAGWEEGDTRHSVSSSPVGHIGHGPRPPAGHRRLRRRCRVYGVMHITHNNNNSSSRSSSNNNNITRDNISVCNQQLFFSRV
ncbi:unnamed protein product [Aphis gossypii]|uniref:Secreted protein n=1 Tax=Aphis gossypii TaxID=80765 RepID=A0A9P0ING1_APHGO|nr:unnamed protein product [Aphis gossypii]